MKKIETYQYFNVRKAEFINFVILFLTGLKKRGAYSYYISIYVLSILLFIKCLDLDKSNAIFIRLNSLIIALAISLGSISTIYHYKYFFPKTLDSVHSKVSELKKLGQIGIIAEYWNSYISSCPDPTMIIATPHDQAEVRNYKLAELVFKQPKIYVIKDMWFEWFPDTLVQFDHMLIKTGEPFEIANCTLSEYKLIN